MSEVVFRDHCFSTFVSDLLFQNFRFRAFGPAIFFQHLCFITCVSDPCIQHYRFRTSASDASVPAFQELFVSELVLGKLRTEAGDSGAGGSHLQGRPGEPSAGDGEI